MRLYAFADRVECYLQWNLKRTNCKILKQKQIEKTWSNWIIEINQSYASKIFGGDKMRSRSIDIIWKTRQATLQL